MAGPTPSLDARPNAHPAHISISIDQLTRMAGRRDPAADTRTLPLAFRRIVLAIDESGATDHAVAWARVMAQTFRATVDVLHVSSPRVLFDYYMEWSAAPITPLEAFQDSEAGARRLVQRVEAKLLRAGVRAKGTVVAGFPTEEIPKFVKQSKADLLIVGFNPRGPINRFILGHIADAVKDEVGSAVLVAKGPPGRERLVAGVDGSRSSKRAALIAVRLAHAWKGHAWVLHAVEPPTFDLGEDALRSLRSLTLASPPSVQDARVDYEVEFGSAPERIVRFAGRKKAGLVVLGSRGLTGLRRLALGSVSNRVARAAPCSVLLIKS